MNETSRARSGRKVFVLGAAALCQGVPFAFMFLGVPAILRDLDESLSTITLYSLLFLPWAGRFLYAPFLDRIYSRRFGRRRTWLTASLLATSAVLFLTAAFIPAGSNPAFMAALFLMNLMLSVNDTVVGAYSSDILEYEEMSWSGIIRLSGNYLGMMLGGGLLLSSYASLGWEATFHLLGGTTLVLALPVALHREIAPVHETARETDGDKPSLVRFARSPGVGWFILAEVLVVTSLYTGSQIYPPFLVDLGFSSDDIGGILMFWGYPFGFLTALASGWIMRRMSPNKILPLSMAAVACVQFYAFHLAGTQATLAQAVVLMCSEMVLDCLSGVAFYTVMAAFCVGPQAATNIGLLSSIANITPLLIPPLLGRIGDAHGYRTLFAVLVCVSLIFFLAVAVIFRTRLSDSKALSSLNGRRCGPAAQRGAS